MIPTASAAMAGCVFSASTNFLLPWAQHPVRVMSLAGNRAGLNVLNGAMAEAMFADRNASGDWQYVRNPNAPQHDFTKIGPNGVRGNVQVKFHEDRSRCEIRGPQAVVDITNFAEEPRKATRSGTGALRLAMPQNMILN